MPDLDDVRRLALALPGASERTSYGTPSFHVSRALFARVTEHEGGLLLRVADLDEKDALLAAEPDVLFTVPHYDGHPSVLVRLDRVDAELLAELVTDAWRTRAGVRLRRELDGGG